MTLELLQSNSPSTSYNSNCKACSSFFLYCRFLSVSFFPCLDDEEFFEGRVFGEISSSVKVHMSSDGILTASIRTAEDTYHVEASSDIFLKIKKSHCGKNVLIGHSGAAMTSFRE